MQIESILYKDFIQYAFSYKECLLPAFLCKECILHAFYIKNLYCKNVYINNSYYKHFYIRNAWKNYWLLFNVGLSLSSASKNNKNVIKQRFSIWLNFVSSNVVFENRRGETEVVRSDLIGYIVLILRISAVFIRFELMIFFLLINLNLSFYTSRFSPYKTVAFLWKTSDQTSNKQTGGVEMVHWIKCRSVALNEMSNEQETVCLCLWEGNGGRDT